VPGGSHIAGRVNRAPFFPLCEGGRAELTKRYDEPIEVTPKDAERSGAAPVAFAWRGRRYDVDQRLASWRDGAEWWKHNGARDREYFRVLAHPAGALATGDLDADGFLRSAGAVYDVYCDRATGTWRLARIWD
jgi:hypothetical protein